MHQASLASSCEHCGELLLRCFFAQHALHNSSARQPLALNRSSRNRQPLLFISPQTSLQTIQYCSKLAHKSPGTAAASAQPAASDATSKMEAAADARAAAAAADPCEQFILSMRSFQLNQAAAALGRLRRQSPNPGLRILKTLGALPALVSALCLECTAATAAGVVAIITSPPQQYVGAQRAIDTPGMVEALVVALLRFDDAIRPALNALHNIALWREPAVRHHLLSVGPSLFPRLMSALSMIPAAERSADWAIRFIANHSFEQARLAADTEGALPALVAALSEPATAESAAGMLKQIVQDRAELAARVLRADGSLDALVAKGAALTAADCAALNCGALKQLSDHKIVGVPAHVAAAVAPSLAAADSAGRSNVRLFLCGISGFKKGALVDALELQASAVRSEVSALQGQAAELESLLASLTAALQPPVSNQLLSAAAAPAAAPAPAPPPATDPVGAAVMSTVAAINNISMGQWPADLGPITSPLVLGLHSAAPTTAASAANALHLLCGRAFNCSKLIVEAPGLLPALVAALGVEAAAPAAARTVDDVLSWRPICDSTVPSAIASTEGMVAALVTSLVQSEAAVGPAMSALRSLDSHGCQEVLQHVAATEGAVPALVATLLRTDTFAPAASTLQWLMDARYDLPAAHP